MDSEPSFQSLMARVELEHFLAYLACNGWQGVPEVRRDRLRFELPDRGSAPYVLLLPVIGPCRQRQASEASQFGYGCEI